MSEFNLITEKWISVLYRNGRFDRVGIQTAFTEAGAIRQIAASNPLDLFAVHRFLLTLLYWKADLAGGVAILRTSILEQMEIPENVRNAIEAEKPQFKLFDEKIPFLQDPTLRNSKPDKSSGYLFAELATGTNIAHFHHGDDKKMELCLECVAWGMLRVVPWSQSGGSGLSPSIHNAPPLMAIAIGDNLAKTLACNLVPLDCKPGVAKWTGHFQPTNNRGDIPYLEALTWNPRRIWIPKPYKIEKCWRCGKATVDGIGKIVFNKNENTKQGDDKKPFQWKDPAAFYPTTLDKENKSSKKNLFTTEKSSEEVQTITSADLKVLIGNREPNASVVMQNPEHHSWQLIIPCTDPANNKTFDHRSIEFDALNHDALDHDIEKGIRNRHTYKNTNLDGWKAPDNEPKREHREFVWRAISCLDEGDWTVLSNAAFRSMNDAIAAFDRMSGIYWSVSSPRPSRNAAWLTLKLMASVPNRFRWTRVNDGYSPLSDLPKQQLQRKGRSRDMFQYPLALPRGERLEAGLRANLTRHIAEKNSQPIDWAGLCHALDELLNKTL